MEPATPRFPKLFSVEEANALIPKLTELLEEVAKRRDELRRKSPQIEAALRSSLFNGGGKPASEYGVDAYKLYLAVDVIRSLGIVPKDLDSGLLDFPHERNGRVVYLCWHPPETEVSYWHDIDAGYSGRKPL